MGHLDVEALSRLEVHDVDVEVVVRCCWEQLAKGKHLPWDRQHRLVCCVAVLQLWFTLHYTAGHAF